MLPTALFMGWKGWIDCFEKARLAGSSGAAGPTTAGEMAGHADKLAAAYELG